MGPVGAAWAASEGRHSHSHYCGSLVICPVSGLWEPSGGGLSLPRPAPPLQPQETLLLAAASWVWALKPAVSPGSPEASRRTRPLGSVVNSGRAQGLPGCHASQTRAQTCFPHTPGPRSAPPTCVLTHVSVLQPGARGDSRRGRSLSPCLPAPDLRPHPQTLQGLSKAVLGGACSRLC